MNAMGGIEQVESAFVVCGYTRGDWAIGWREIHQQDGKVHDLIICRDDCTTPALIA
jgi:hypothetical protein